MNTNVHELIVGQDVPIQIINNGLKKDKLSNSVLFYGPYCVGKLKTAIYLAKQLNCLSNSSLPCGVCNNCRQINQFTFPDLMLINTDDPLPNLRSLEKLLNIDNNNLVLQDMFMFYVKEVLHRLNNNYFNFVSSFEQKSKKEKEKFNENLSSIEQDLKDIFKKYSDKKTKSLISLIENNLQCINFDNIPIDTIREINKRMFQKPNIGKKKIIIINGIDKLKTETANTFLKTLEEPPLNSQIILITENISNILPTIRSRCLNIGFNKLSGAIRSHILKNILNLHYDNVMNESLSDSNISIFDSFLNLNKDKNDNITFIDTLFNDIIVNYESSDQIFSLSEPLFKSNIDIKKVFDKLSEIFYNVKLIKYGIKNIQNNYFNVLVKIPDLEIDNYIKQISQEYSRIVLNNANPVLILDNLFLEIGRLFNKYNY